MPFPGRYILTHGGVPATGGALGRLPFTALDTLGRGLRLLAGTLELSTPALYPDPATLRDTGSGTFQVRLKLRGGDPPMDFERGASGRYRATSPGNSPFGDVPNVWLLELDGCQGSPQPTPCFEAPFAYAEADEGQLTSRANLGFRTEQDTIGGTPRWRPVTLRWARQ